MNDQLSKWQSQILACHDIGTLEELRISLLGKNGVITAQLKELGQLDPEQRREKGAIINALRDTLTQTLNNQKDSIQRNILEKRLEQERIDITLPPRPHKMGKVHLLSSVLNDIQQYFINQGFTVHDGPEIDSEFHNFDALNIPAHHPARQSHDTFYLKDLPGMLLRTHTSTVQIRTLKKQTPPLRIIAPGRVYRSDDLDATHSPMFNQIEGLILEPGIHFGHLKGCIIDFCRWFFDMPDLPVRFRPSFFPFTEPSAEVDLGCKREGEKLILGNGGDWLEILGCGMVHPNVLVACEIDPDSVQGFAFGMGLERLIMLKYGIADIRQLYDTDMRWLSHAGTGAAR